MWLLFGAGSVFGDIRLPAIIGDNMVLQQNQKVTIWGWAEPGEEVHISVSWHPMEWAVKANRQGKWRFMMEPPQAGGPYEMTLKGKNKIRIQNILVGEVWICSGQSNMQMLVKASADSEKEIAAANYPKIRLFTVQRNVAREPLEDCQGQWEMCEPQTIPSFSAVGYFFGRTLLQTLDVPIGLVHTS
jgi:sialate O-acetylesterase